MCYSVQYCILLLTKMCPYINLLQYFVYTVSFTVIYNEHPLLTGGIKLTRLHYSVMWVLPHGTFFFVLLQYSLRQVNFCAAPDPCSQMSLMEFTRVLFGTWGTNSPIVSSGQKWFSKYGMRHQNATVDTFRINKYLIYTV